MEMAKKAVKNVKSEHIKEFGNMKGSAMKALPKFVMDCVLLLF